MGSLLQPPLRTLGTRSSPRTPSLHSSDGSQVCVPRPELLCHHASHNEGCIRAPSCSVSCRIRACRTAATHVGACSRRKDRKDRKHASHLLAQLRKYDALPDPFQVRIAVSDRMNPKLDVSSPAINREHAREFKKRYMNPAMIQPGPDQKGEPWLSLHRRLQRSVDVSAARQAADQAIFEGTSYDDTNLARSHACAPPVVELSEPPSLSALKQGIIAGQPYISSAASSSGAVAKPTTGEETLVLPNQPCEVALPKYRRKSASKASVLHRSHPSIEKCNSTTLWRHNVGGPKRCTRSVRRLPAASHVQVACYIRP